ncbi:hypothetical protein V1264_010979 [Littorina saxatilis]|uniref:Aminopeptidase N-like N-terminal domain-containing protein n=6 Tax=Littorina TaxID=31213 RepID=A0AAN9BXA2_9CAEN
MSTVQINRRLLYLLAFLFVAIPILVGVLVWHATDNANDSEDSQTVTLGNRSTVSEGLSGGQGQSTGVRAPTTTREPTPEEIAAKPWLSLRLPEYQVPLHYDITLYPDFYGDHGTFYGNETVDVEVKQTTRFLLIHVYKLTIHDVKVVKADTKEALEVARTFEEAKNQFLVVETKSDMEAGTVVGLHLQFSGSLTESIVGFYKSSYVNSKTGETR